MSIKMRVLYSSSKAKIRSFAGLIKSEYDLGVNSVDVIPPAYSCDKERAVVLIISASGKLQNKDILFLKEMTKLRSANTALVIDGDQNAAKALLSEAGTNVFDEVLFIKGGIPFMKGYKPEEKDALLAWVSRFVNQLK